MTKLAGSLNKYGFGQADNVWSVDGICPTIITGGNQIGHQINILEEDDDGKCVCLGNVHAPTFNEMTGRVYSTSGLSPTMRTFCGGGQETKIAIYEREQNMGRLRIRKLTEGECMRLMGFEEKDTEACKEAGLSKTNIYHQSGDSIVTTVLAGIFGELFDPDYRNKIEDYCDKLHEEVE